MKFEKGDRVKIVSVVGGEYGLYDKYIGRTGVVLSVRNGRVLVELEDFPRARGERFHSCSLWCQEVVPAFQETILPKELFEI
jgi:hypothetical protein